VKGLRLAAALVCALPWLRALHATPVWLAALVDVGFFPLCHHWAGRVIVLQGQAMCVCSRCAGLYAGLAGGFLLGAPKLGDHMYARLLGLALFLTALDVVTQDAGLHAPFHPVRLLTGGCVGWIVGAWMVRSTSPSRRSPRRPQLG
jgi:uncharacterized membrane protein